MDLIINGKPRSFPARLTLRDVVEWVSGLGPHVAVAVNDTVVPRTRLRATAVQDGDRI
ncbi:MAG: sulfur carrier protein ThiS, partial [Deltaproteobacteria bacterium]|nr:sulfur carrier protein ThiS [Deltaproteobacteria bacterium]